MSPKQQNEERMMAIPAQGVWETLDAIQQKAVLQAIVNLCQQIIEIWERRKQDEHISDE